MKQGHRLPRIHNARPAAEALLAGVGEARTALTLLRKDRDALRARLLAADVALD